MVKPVLIVKNDGRMSHEDYDTLRDKGFSKELKEEYHILLVIDDTIESSFEFQCLNVEDSDKIDFKELQQHIDNILKK
jgi:hypothetical protein